MARNVLPRLALVILLALPASAMAQEVTPSHSEPLSTTSGDAVDTPRSDAAAAAATDSDAATQAILDKSLIERLWVRFPRRKIPTARSIPIALLSRRPTRSSPAAASSSSRASPSTCSRPPSPRPRAYDLPELATRIGMANGVEFRTYWFGQTWAQTQPHPGGRATQLNGLSDMEIGFKWQLLLGDENRKWLPTTALITSIYAPTGGTSPVLVRNGRSLHQSDLRLDTHRETHHQRQHRLSRQPATLRAPRRQGKLSSDTTSRWSHSIRVAERTTLFYE